jgi:hypothetical protein
MNTSLTDAQRARLHDLAKAQAHRLRRKAINACFDLVWFGLVRVINQCICATSLLKGKVFKPVRKPHH